MLGQEPILLQNPFSMTTYIVLLKGINVGGHKKVPMAELRELLATEGFQNLQTFIQSGNVILKSSEVPEYIEAKIHKVIEAHFGFKVSVIVKTRSELQSIFDKSPFSQNIKEKSYFILLNKIPENKFVKEAENISYENEEFKIINDCLYFYSFTGFGNSKFNMNTFERKLNVIGTARNFNTMVKLLSLSAE